MAGVNPMTRSWRTLLPAAAVALVWFYEGFWCKVLPGRADHRAIVADIPFVPGAAVTPLLVAVGLAEVGIGLWVLSGFRPYGAAAVQTGLLVAFNAGGLVFSGSNIEEPGRMLTANLALTALIWLVAQRHSAARRPLAVAA
jgi:uncharacterized membrane protein YphA (DoxX/SURF4 family)